MPDSDLNDTKPNRVLPDTQPISPVTPARKNFPRWSVALIVVVMVAIGLLTGYDAGMSQRYAAEDTQMISQLDEQFQLGMSAMQSGNYELAKQYFEYILQEDSNYPGILAAYSDLLLQMQITPTPIFTPTPLVTPTPDLRGVQEIFDTALQLLNAGDWNGAISNLDSLRKENPTFQTAEVDGMYYMALRQRGVGKIASTCENINLEGGIYDITLAEHFVGTGNLDSYAESLRTYARLYIIGASFWDQDWLQAQSFFAQVMAAYPSMSDSSCMNSTQRWYEATLKVADDLLAGGDPCGAEQQYDAALSISVPGIANAYPTATAISNLCEGGGGGGGGGGGKATEETTPRPTREQPTDVPTEVPTTEALTP